MEGGGGADLPADGFAQSRPLAQPDRQRGLEQSYAAALAEVQALRRELAEVYASHSWKLTEPLRRLRTRRIAAAAASPPSPVPATPAVQNPLLPAVPAWLPDNVCVIAPPGADAGRLAGAAAARGFTLLTLPAPAASWAAACNEAAAAADGDWIVLWDGHSEARPGWLAALAETFDSFRAAGMAGAALLDAWGRLAAAGAVIAADGDVQPLGKGAQPDDPDYAFAAPVETLPLGAVMLPTTLWRRFGGLDTTIASPEHALDDLAERMRAAGLLVIRQPAAQLAQAPAAPGDAWEAALGRMHLRQQRILREGGLAVLGPLRRVQPRVLLIDHFVPTPDRDGGSVCLHALLRMFVTLGWQPTLLPVDDLARADHYVSDLRRLGVRVMCGGGYRTVADMLAVTAQPFDLVWLRRGSLAFPTMFEQFRRHSPDVRIVFDTTDLHFLRMEREARLTRSAERLDAAFRMQQRELAAMLEADCTVLITEVEQRTVLRLLPQVRTCCIPYACDIPGCRNGFAARQGVVFIGSFRHMPNVDGMLWFAREVWPLLRGRLDGKLRIVGPDAPAEVQALAGPDIEVLGHVADLDAVLEGCRLTVAPLRYGAGMKGKVVASLAAGVPCVATPIGAEGMTLNDGQNICLAERAEDFAAAVIALHEDAALWQRLSEGGLAYAKATCSVEAVGARVAALLADLGLPVPDGARGR